jgi:hypothetical protein
VGAAIARDPAYLSSGTLSAPARRIEWHIG